MRTESLPAAYDFLLGGGEMGQLIRSIDWSTTPVGSIEKWPQSLRTSVSIMLNTHFPMYVAWGNDFTQFYNDGYRPILGSTKHPAAMGKSTRFTFSEIWNIIGPMFEGVMEGKAVGFTDFMLPLDRHGFTEECYFIFSYSPIKQEDGSTGGVLVTVTETSERVLGERRLKTLRELADRTYQCKTLAASSDCILQALANNKFDIPFSLFYSYHPERNEYLLEGTTGISIENTSLNFTKIEELARHQPLTAVPITEIFDTITFEDGLPWPETPHQCSCSLLSWPDQKNGFGTLVLGISPRLRCDDHYQNFFKLLTDQVTTALTNVNAFEQERKRAEALAEIDKAKTAFFSNISHEFRTPLTLMLGPLEELLRVRALQGKQRDYAEAAHRNAVRLLRLVNTLLDFSKIESGRLQAAFRVVDLPSLTKDITSNFTSIVEKAGLTLKMDFEPLSQDVYVDYGMWEKIVLNLLSNAFKYTLEGAITVSLKQQHDHVILTVRDTGVGIPKNELPRMFERFHRVANSAGRSYEGTGIGLSLVAELVKIHQGTITVDSEVGKGTTFIVSIPTGHAHLPGENVIHEADRLYASVVADSFIKESEVLSSKEVYQDHHTSNPAVDHKSPEHATVLVADDNADMVNYLVRILHEQYSVIAAANGKEALDKINAYRPDLVISDVMMPVMDGIELLKSIKADERNANIPVMLLSARAGEESRIEGFDIGADDYLIKPFSANELLARVKSQINIAKTRSHLSNMLKQVFEQTPAAISILRKKNFIVEFANDLYLQLVDKGPDFVGKPLFDALPELESQVVRELLEQVMETGVPYMGKELEVHLQRRGQKEKTYFNFIYHPLRERDQTISGVIVVCFEVTDLVTAKNRAEKSEAMLEAKVKERTFELEQKNSLLEKANEELEQFAYVASHDLQEPLRKIRTFCSILERNFEVDQRAMNYFDKIHSSADRMAQLIKDVLNYSRLVNLKSEFQTVDLKEVLSSVIVDMELLIEEKGAKVIANELPSVNGLQLQLQQLFSNLLGNALKFTNTKPVIEISGTVVSAEEVRTYQPDANGESYVRLSFKDNGIGFDPKFASQIFTIFQRLHDKETSGTGIGLALCKKIVEIHCGYITATSIPGEGSVFLVYLPHTIQR